MECMFFFFRYVEFCVRSSGVLRLRSMVNFTDSTDGGLMGGLSELCLLRVWREKRLVVLS